MSSRETLTVPGTDAGLRRAASALADWTEIMALPAETRRRVLTALDEALSNVVRHGFSRQPGQMTLTLSCDADRLSVSVADDAPAFNPLLVAPPDVSQPLDARRPGGLGVALIRALSDEATYVREAGQNVLALSWRIDEHAAPRRD